MYRSESSLSYKVSGLPLQEHGKLISNVNPITYMKPKNASMSPTLVTPLSLEHMLINHGLRSNSIPITQISNEQSIRMRGF